MIKLSVRKIMLLVIVFLVGCTDSHTESDELTLIAHRGANNIAPEHTLAAYKKAVDLNADYIEIDLRMTKDGHMVSIHDHTVDRTTNGEGEVSSLSLSELKKLDAGSSFSEEFKGEEIPTLEEIFDTFGKGTHYYIETRLVEEKPLMEDKLVTMIKNKGLLDNVIIQSFSSESLRKVHQLNSEVPLVQLLYKESVSKVLPDEISSYAIGVGPHARDIDNSFVEKMHASGLEVHVWFDHDNEQELLPNIVSLSVDAIFTDFLDNTQEVVKLETFKQ